MDHETATAVPTQAEPEMPKKRKWWGREGRSGLGTTEITLIILAIIITGLLAGIGITRARSAREGAEYSVLQTNIDQIAAIADTYWNQHAGDLDGRRKISLLGFCQFANSQLSAEEINLRTLQFVDTDGDPVAAANGSSTPTGLDGLATAISVMDRVTSSTTEAGCPFDTGDLADANADILAVDADVWGTFAAPGAATQWDNNGAGTAAAWPNQEDTDDLGAFQGELETAGLLSTRTVWMAMISPDGTQLAAGDTANTDLVPDGTDTAFARTGTLRFPESQHGTEALVFGGQTPDGTSFCLIKVFDAANNDEIGEYRVSRAANDDNSFAICTQGVNATDENQPRRGGDWPEPR